MEVTANHTPASAVVETYLAAFAAGRVDEIVSLLADDVVWHIDGEPGVSTVGLLQGPEQVRRWLIAFPQNFRPREFVINEIIAQHDSVLVLGRFRHTVVSTQHTVGSDMIIHFTVTNGKIRRYQIFEDSALLARAFDAGDEWSLQQVRINGTLYRYRDIGEGPVLLFAHGLFTSHHIFAAQVQALSHAYRCIVVDMPGHGLSGYDATGWTLDDLSRDLALMIEELALGKITIVGQSQGAMVALRLAATYPKLLAGLVLIGTSARAELPERLDIWRRQRETLLKGADEAREALFTTLQSYVNSEEWLQNHPHEAAEERAMMHAHNREGLALALDAAVFDRGDITHLLPTIAAPTLVIVGEEDRATPVELSKEIAALLPDAQLLTLAKTGHHPPTEAADAVTAAIAGFIAAK
ncbi:alpha/beta fold hydrolase [Kosakonia cowanii]|uniref:alpha/beta fold hydrolase n=1 Tax=Kosakonia cowanii TaxID=208223 RepID=UPI0025A9C2CE|nr:alpha/beta fold hydrolase [Kosakonia cowanii]MDM9615018.1 alpha/beta fold hydrolase [Kosakonia cowanii]MDP4560433.1 alpha/beta fold hydrolase [Kosakonia cowanii]